jgi:hypothetical protein
VPSYYAGCWWWTVRFSVAKLAAAAGHPTRYPIAIRASIITGCKLAKYCGGERRETGCKLTVGLDTRTKKLRERGRWTIY